MLHRFGSYLLIAVLSHAILPLPASHAAGEDMAVARKRVDSMTAQEQEQLLHNYERFTSYSADEQQRLRTLVKALAADPNGSALRQVLARYHQWLTTLSPGERSELFSMEPATRVEKIKQLQSEHATRLAANESPLPVEDLKKIFGWLESFAGRYQQKLLEMAPLAKREQIEALPEPMRRKALAAILIQRWQFTGVSEFAPAVVDDLHRLIMELSPQAQKRAAAANTAELKRRLLQDWLHQVVQRREEVGGSRWLPLAQDELAKFFQELSSEDRERLLNMPREQMQAELRRLYWQNPGDRARMGPRPPGGKFPPPGRPQEGERPGLFPRRRDGDKFEGPPRESPRREEPSRDKPAEPSDAAPDKSRRDQESPGEGG